MIAVRRSPLLAIIISLAVSTAAAASDESLARAKELYRTAAYDEALAALDQIARESAGAARVEATEYRLFCLIALDRKVDAHVTIELLVNEDPFHQLTANEASPRVRTLFNEIRQSLLPGIVQREYATAKAAFDSQDPQSAEQFDRVLRLLDDPQLGPTQAFADLRTVASGFRDLSKARQQAVIPPSAPPPEPAQPTVTAAATELESARPDAPTDRAAPDGAPEAVVYQDGDLGVTPPVTLQQSLPQWVVPFGMRPEAWQPEAILQLIIDEQGNVTSATLRRPFHPTYDAQLVKTALGWKYEPARKDGVPVRFVRNVAIRLGGAN